MLFYTLGLVYVHMENELGICGPEFLHECVALRSTSVASELDAGGSMTHRGHSQMPSACGAAPAEQVGLAENGELLGVAWQSDGYH